MLLGWVLAGAAVTHADNFQLSGVVTDSAGNPLRQAEVVLARTETGVWSDAEGRWVLGGVSSVGERSKAEAIPLTGHLILQPSGRMEVRFQGRDLRGRGCWTGGSQSRMNPRPQGSVPAARSSAESPVDTLVFYWKGFPRATRILSSYSVESLGTVVLDTSTRRSNVPWNESIAYGTLVDPRDGQSYRTVRIGKQNWMAENLNFRARNSFWSKKSPDNGASFGRLYSWTGALGLPDSCERRACTDLVRGRVGGVCPAGWHVPKRSEWQELIGFAGGDSVAGWRLMPVSGNGTVSPGGEDRFGFRALLGGFSTWDAGSTMATGYLGQWWSSLESAPEKAHAVTMQLGQRGIPGGNNPKNYSVSLRCLENGSEGDTGLYAGYIDPAQAVRGHVLDAASGEEIPTVRIGDITWMAENLDVEVEGSWANQDSTDSGVRWGRLYRWSAAMGLPSSCDSSSCAGLISSPHRGICPVDWHVPDSVEWATLVANVGNRAEGILEPTAWSAPATLDPPTDAYGFNALPAGSTDDGRNWERGAKTWWISSSERTSNAAFQAGFSPCTGCQSSGIALTHHTWKSGGVSLRCARNR